MPSLDLAVIGLEVWLKINTAKRRMLEGKPAIGVASGTASPLVAEALSHAGFDYVLLDNQHGAWDDETCLLGLRSIVAGPATPMARVRQNDFFAIGRLLDQGALGIVVPMVDSAQQARAAADAMRYPPRGSRSYGPYLSQYLGSDYDRWIDEEVFLAVQIESARAVEHVDEIMSVDGVDGCWIGPVDLAKTMGVDPKTPEGASVFQQAVLHILESCRKTYKIPGIYAGTVTDARGWIEKGFLFVTAAYDATLLLRGGQDVMRQMGR